MAKDLTKKLYDAAVADLERAVKHGEKMIPSLYSVMEERKKQLDFCLAAFADANAKLQLVRAEYGAESLEVHQAYRAAEPYLRTMMAAMDQYQLAFNDAYSFSNGTGMLREKLQTFLANAKTPEMVVGAPGNALENLLAFKMPRGGFDDNGDN